MREIVVLKRMGADDPEAMWKLEIEEDGVNLCRPAARLFIPWERLPAITRALNDAYREKKE